MHFQWRKKARLEWSLPQKLFRCQIQNVSKRKSGTQQDKSVTIYFVCFAYLFVCFVLFE